MRFSSRLKVQIAFLFLYIKHVWKNLRHSPFQRLVVYRPMSPLNGWPSILYLVISVLVKKYGNAQLWKKIVKADSISAPIFDDTTELSFYLFAIFFSDIFCSLFLFSAFLFVFVFFFICKFSNTGFFFISAYTNYLSSNTISLRFPDLIKKTWYLLCDYKKVNFGNR